MSRTALVVDDSTSMLQMVRLTLRDAGFEIIAAGNGSDALKKIEGAKLSLVVTDLNMPVMDGIQLIKTLRNMPEFKFVPIIMVSTESQNTKREAGRDAGATAWLVKPFMPQELLATVRKFVK